MAVKLVVEADTGSNQPDTESEKYAVQLAAVAYWYIQPSKFRVSVLKPKIDRLSVTFPIHDTAARKAILDHLIALEADASSTVTKWKKNKGWGASKYHLDFAINLGANGSAMVQCASIGAPVAFLRF